MSVLPSGPTGVKNLAKKEKSEPDYGKRRKNRVGRKRSTTREFQELTLSLDLLIIDIA